MSMTSSELPTATTKVRLAKTIFQLLRAARAGETDQALLALQALGYTAARAQRAVLPYGGPVELAYGLLSLSDQEAATRHASEAALMSGLDCEARPLAWRLLQIESAREVVGATWRRAEDDSPEEDAASAAYELLEAATDRAREVLLASDEERDYEVREEGGSWEITSCPARLAADVEASVRDGDGGDSEGAWQWHGYSSCEKTGEEDAHEVTFEEVEPDCRSRGNGEHAWRSPFSVLGGCKENPGVLGKGGGVIVKELCTHCGCYRSTDTWACNGRGGQMTAVSYEVADEASLAWIRGDVDLAQREAIVAACNEVDDEHRLSALPFLLNGWEQDLSGDSVQGWRIRDVGFEDTTEEQLAEVLTSLGARLGEGWSLQGVNVKDGYVVHVEAPTGFGEPS